MDAHFSVTIGVGLVDSSIEAYAYSRGLYAGASIGFTDYSGRPRANKKFYGPDFDFSSPFRYGSDVPKAVEPLFEALRQASGYISI